MNLTQFGTQSSTVAPREVTSSADNSTPVCSTSHPSNSDTPASILEAPAPPPTSHAVYEGEPPQQDQRRFILPGRVVKVRPAHIAVDVAIDIERDAQARAEQRAADRQAAFSVPSTRTPWGAVDRVCVPHVAGGAA